MNRRKPLVVLTRKLPDVVEARMAELFDVRLAQDRPMQRPELLAAIAQADVLVPTISDRIDADLIAQAGDNLKMIASFGNGTEHIDIAAAAKRNIMVTNTPNVLTEDTADMTMALILAVPRRLVEGANVLTHTGNWPGWSPNWMLGHRIRGRHIGIIGMGRIGMAVARRARTFGLTIHYHNRRRANTKIEEQLEATYWDDLDAMLARMDIISLNCPATPETFHLLSARRLALMKPTACVINTARGGIIDEAALIDSLEHNRLAGAGLDVFEKEPDIDARLLELARAGKVVLLPHMASATLESRAEMGEKVIINIRAFFDHHRPPDRILPPQN
ncbi:MAG: Putative D-isomer specific 2-hydroxyacid dehydrogenase family protein glyoxylate reductase (glycolate reductase) [Candidatus Tokpelaia hoelldobleri]|uniref:D-isomer specific 2-hydroxyacid dehydrogenase family protein glyoxylate reductase (Glycolate reductase) n=1 Tax=Candidatus Tokpelaia hoelldobleri TaxID=1902579 RepID=A0A1U9JWF6_9HYPH|nr:MAG: Putative D-isomer specific 2-hydroxyacid dehydrogenase family protein glyoxylate reductase (glycolate reductase) [Candidatus Tokpelaia hoelldoblerii]